MLVVLLKSKWSFSFSFPFCVCGSGAVFRLVGMSYLGDIENELEKSDGLDSAYFPDEWLWANGREVHLYSIPQLCYQTQDFPYYY